MWRRKVLIYKNILINRYWSFISFLVLASGRAYCGKRLSVNEGDILYGSMKKNLDNSWTVNSTDITKNT